MNTRTNEWMHEVFDIWNGGLASVSCICAYFADAIFQKCSEQFIFFQHFQGDIGLLLESRAHFTDPIFYKSSGPNSFLRFLCEIEVSLQSRAHFVGHFPGSSRAPAETETSFGDHGSHFTRKNAGFRARECFQTWIHAFPTSHTSQLLLAWWCGCHDDWGDDVAAIMVRKLAMTTVRNSEVS